MPSIHFLSSNTPARLVLSSVRQVTQSHGILIPPNLKLSNHRIFKPSEEKLSHVYDPWYQRHQISTLRWLVMIQISNKRKETARTWRPTSTSQVNGTAGKVDQRALHGEIKKAVMHQYGLPMEDETAHGINSRKCCHRSTLSAGCTIDRPEKGR